MMIVDEIVIGLDIGTTSVKAVAFDMKGNVICEIETLIQSYYPKLNQVEQDPVEVDQQCRRALQRLLSKEEIKSAQIVGIGFSSAMHSLICVNDKMEPLSPALIWTDGRSMNQVKQLNKKTRMILYEQTGAPIHPMTPVMKLRWMKETSYLPYEKASYFMSIKEYVIYQWFHVRVIDYSMAAATGLMNIHAHAWDEDALKIAGVGENQLSQIVAPTTILPTISKQIAQQIGMKGNPSFVIGAADGQLANLGSGAIRKGEAAITVGTSGAIRQMTDRITTGKKMETFCYPFTKQLSIVGGPTNNAGNTLQWVKDLFNDKDSFGSFIKKADHVPIGANGLIFHPYINGERAPLWDQEASGNFSGLNTTHQKEHFIRAVMEGIIFNLYHIAESIMEQTGEIKTLYVNGGLARSEALVQMVADIFNKEVYLPKSHQSSAWGAAWTALVALEKKENFADIKKHIPIGKIVQPNTNNHFVYMHIFKTYKVLAENVVAALAMKNRSG